MVIECPCEDVHTSEAFGTIALRVAHSVFRNANVQQPGGMGRLRVARDIATWNCAFDMHVSGLLVYRRPGQCVRYGTCAVSPSGALRTFPDMHASKSIVRAHVRRPGNDRYIRDPRRRLAR